MNTATQYQIARFPLDGIRIDVDLQNEYRTFTTSPQKVPDVKDMYTKLREMGIKCSTNITPVINKKHLANGNYATLQTGLDNWWES